MGGKHSTEDFLKSLEAILDLIADDLSPSDAEKAKKLRKDLDEVAKREEKRKAESDPSTDL